METSELKALYDAMVETDPDRIRFLELHNRSLPVVMRKQLFSAVARLYGATYEQIGKYLHCGHSNVINSVKKAQGYISIYPAVKRRYYEIREEFEFRTMGPPLWIAD